MGNYAYPWENKFEKFEIFGKPALFTCCRVNRDTAPKGVYVYDLREDGDEGNVVEVKDTVVVNHFGTIIMREPLEGNTMHGIEVGLDDYNFVGDWSTIEEFTKESTSNE